MKKYLITFYWEREEPTDAGIDNEKITSLDEWLDDVKQYRNEKYIVLSIVPISKRMINRLGSKI